MRPSIKSLLGISILMLCCSDNCNAFLVKQNVAAMIPHNQQYQAKHIRSSKQIPRGGDTRQHLRSNASELSMVPDGIGAPLQQSSLIFLATNALGFLISVFTGSHKHLDLLGTGAFALASLPTLLSSCFRVSLSSAAVFVWGSKLASFLFFRALKVKTDGRLDDTLSTFSGTFGFWFISFIWGIVCSLPHTLGTTTTTPGSPITLAIGGTVYLLGLATESMADYQKWTFKSNNPGQFCNVGLWSVSQHPNFFGNLLLWTGILIMNSDSLIQIEGGGEGIVSNTLAILWGSRRFALACLSPLFMWTLFSGQANGSITNAAELAGSRYGKDPNYNKYIAAVPQIVPNIFSWLKQLVLGFRGV